MNRVVPTIHASRGFVLTFVQTLGGSLSIPGNLNRGADYTRDDITPAHTTHEGMVFLEGASPFTHFIQGRFSEPPKTKMFPIGGLSVESNHRLHGSGAVLDFTPRHSMVLRQRVAAPSLTGFGGVGRNPIPISIAVFLGKTTSRPRAMK